MPEKTVKEHFKNVDFLRFIFAIIIVMFHGRNATVLPYLLFPTFKHCHVCVDFFFIISGFFLFYSIKNIDTVTFAIKRFFRLAPMVWFIVLFTIIASIFIKEENFTLSNIILRCLLLSNIGFAPSTEGALSLGITWFVSVLFWVSIFYFYIHKIFDKKYLNLIIWLIIIFSYALYYSNNHFGTGGHTHTLYHFADIGVLRGLAGIGIGYFISELYKSTFLKQCSKNLKLVITGVEIFSISFLSYYLFFTAKLPGKSGFVYIVVFSILFYLFLSKQGFISKLLEKDIWRELGNASYAIYIIHFPLFKVLHFTLYKHFANFVNSHTLLTFILQTIFAIIIGILVHHLYEIPINRLIKKKILNNSPIVQK